ncbi:MAG: di-heme oxidoredictase family protein [Pseudomonadota bacterium]|nr:di-heme oxidoredictase family protein [Pseudomonadota bacterium]
MFKFFSIRFIFLVTLASLSAVVNAVSIDPNKDLREQLLAIPLSPALGGDTSVDTFGPRAFRSIAPNADNSLVFDFLFGQRMFDVVWDHNVISPALDGLGPTFNRTACRECHEGNGRGQPPEYVGHEMKSMLVRISVPGQDQHGGPKPVPNYGDQLQDRAVPGVAPEGQAIIEWEEIEGTYGDGTKYSLRKPKVKIVNLGYGPLPDDLMVSPRVASQVVGLGLLQSIPEENLYALADPDDANGDGISGRVNIAWDAVSEEMAPGRFGWKANVPSVRHQSAGAALGDMGMTTPLFPNNLCEINQLDCISMAEKMLAKVGSPEIVPEFMDAIVGYMMLIGVPYQRNADDPAVQRGEQLFRGIGCVGCHMPTQVAGQRAMPALAGQVFHPFTDLLIHDMGEGLADNRPDFDASGSEWRTAPLWGLGLMHDVGEFNFYLHDGRARSIAEAILWHGGEAENPREIFRNLGKDQREDLIAFLNSL